MSILRSFLICVTLIVPLTACFKAPTLEERLAGKSGAERDRELYYACIERSNDAISGGHSSNYIGHETRRWTLCEEMNKVNQMKEKKNET